MRTKNVVFIFGNDPQPTENGIKKIAQDPTREIEFHRVGNFAEALKIYEASPTAWEHFITASAPEEAIEFFRPVPGSGPSVQQYW